MLWPCEALILLQCFSKSKNQERKGSKSLCERNDEEKGMDGVKVQEEVGNEEEGNAVVKGEEEGEETGGTGRGEGRGGEGGIRKRRRENME